MAVLVLGATLLPPCADAQKPRKALTKNEVIELLESGVPPARVGELAQQYGVAFEMTPETESELRRAGVTQALLKTLREVAPQASAPPVRSTSPPILLVEASPGGAQVYVDDEPVGTTSSQGRLELSQLGPGDHTIRLALAGYRDYEQSFQLTAGQTTTVTASLEPTKPSAAARPAPGAAPAQTGGPVESLLGATSAPAVPAATAPLARFQVAHDHGSAGTDYCLGWIALGNGMIQYRSMNGTHSFDFPLSTVKEAKKNSVYLAAIGGFHIRLKKGTNYNFVVLNPAGQYQPPDALLDAIEQAMGKQ